MVYVFNPQIYTAKNSFKAILMDLDGTLTNLHTPEIYQLFWNNVMSFIDEGFRKKLAVHFVDLQKAVGYPIGWVLDLQEGNRILTNSKGRIDRVISGDRELDNGHISGTYKNSMINLDFSDNPDHNRPRYKLYCDGFDYMEFLLKSAATFVQGIPRKAALKIIDDAMYNAHHHANGFKRDLIADDKHEKYGIVPDERLIEFLDKVKSWDKKLVLFTSAPRTLKSNGNGSEIEYVRRKLKLMGIEDYFDLVMTDVEKPYCFRDIKKLISDLGDVGVTKPEELFIGGDHLWKDCAVASESGIYTGFRAMNTHIGDTRTTLEEAGYTFIPNGQVIEVIPPTEEPDDLSYYHHLITQHVSVMTNHVANLETILLQ